MPSSYVDPDQKLLGPSVEPEVPESMENDENDTAGEAKSDLAAVVDEVQASEEVSTVKGGNGDDSSNSSVDSFVRCDAESEAQDSGKSKRSSSLSDR